MLLLSDTYNLCKLLGTLKYSEVLLSDVYKVPNTYSSIFKTSINNSGLTRVLSTLSVLSTY